MRRPIRRLFWAYCIPAIIGITINGIYAIVDGVFIGHAMGGVGLAASNLAWPISSFILAFGVMIGSGAASHYSILAGAEKPDEAQIYAANSLVLSLVTSLIVGTLVYILSRQLLVMQNATGEILEFANDYIQITAIASLPFILGTVLPILVRNDQKPRLATIMLVAGAITNIILDWLFIIELDLKLAGAAYSTVAAQLLIAIWGLGYFIRKWIKQSLDLRKFNLNLKVSLGTFVVGFSSFFSIVYIAFVVTVHNHLFLKMGDYQVLAAFAIVGYFQWIYYMFAEGIGIGIQPLISYFFGAGNHNKVRIVFMLGVIYALVIGCVIYIITILFPNFLSGLFLGSNIDQALAQTTKTGFRLHLFSLFADGFIVLCAAYFQAMARAKVATLISIGNMFVQLPFLFVLPLWLGVTGIWIAMPVSNILLGLAVLFYLKIDLKSNL